MSKWNMGDRAPREAVQPKDDYVYIIIKSDGKFLMRSDEGEVFKLVADISASDTIVVERIMRVYRDGSCMDMNIRLNRGKLELFMSTVM